MPDAVTPDRAVPNLPSRDLGITEAFYAGIGFRRAFRDDGWLILRRGSVQLEFFPFHGLDPASNAARCTVRVADVDELAAAIVAAGIPIGDTGAPRLHEVRRQDWGLRAGHLVDPDGNLLTLIEDPATSAASAERAIILSGAGRYADPWHPYAETSARLASLVAEAGYDVEVRDDVDAALATLDDDVRLLVVNAGDPDGPDADGVEPGAGRAAAAAAAGVDEAPFEAAVRRGIGILAMHSAASSLRDYAAFDLAIGGRWEWGRSWHPPYGDSRVHLVGDHVIREGLEDFTVLDERYAALHLTEVIEPIAEHVEDGVRHPLVWAREFGPSRLVYDALGHDARSYDEAEHRALIARAIDWLSRVPAPSAPGATAAPVGPPSGAAG